MIADMEANKKLSPIVAELFSGKKTFHLRLYHGLVSKYLRLRLNARCYFILKIPNKRELQQIASNHSF